MKNGLFLFCCLAAYTISFSQPQKEVKATIDTLLYCIKNKGTEVFAEYTAYQGTDEKRKWKDVYDPSNAEELRAAKQVMEEMKKALGGCNYKEFDTFKEDEQSEGKWYVYTYACGSSKKIHFAFIKIKGRYALGDIDVEDEDDE